ncbi:nitrilase [Rhizobiales bacterium GAS191]|jgi:predicted amidohydrolase|nr:nitrilase [Rhizobiales bacterium GAS113]SED87606.1 nitrilase [Rhizobiales bacterium GAS191]
MKVSLVQMNSISDKVANLAAAKRLVEKAVIEERPDWVLLPEVFDWMGGTSAEKLAIAEPATGGPAYETLRALAREHRIWVHGGSFFERVPGENRAYNTTVVFDRDGREVARYRKIHMFDITAPDGTKYQESASMKPGEAVVTYDCEGVTIGCTICYDLRFAELFAALVERGASLIALPAAFTLQTGKDHWEVLLRARAIETQTYVLAAGQTGAFEQKSKTLHNYGHSMVIDPWGHVVARASDGVGIVSSRLDLSLPQAVRARMPVAEHRRLGRATGGLAIAAE